MHSVELRELVHKKVKEGWSYLEVAKTFDIPKSTVQYIIKPSYKKSGGVGRKEKITRQDKTNIKREISKLKESKARVTSS